MNTKGMIVAIVTAMLVMTMFASSAMAIIVDGMLDPSEWDVYDEMVSDTVGDTCSTGYDITSLWMRVNDDTLFIRMNVTGVPGDADNNGNPDTYTNDGSGNNCGCPNPLFKDYVGVGVDTSCPREQYVVEIDGDNDGEIDYILKYCSGGSALYTADEVKISGVTHAAHDTIVELSVDLDQNCSINPANYCIQGWADTQCNGSEDHVDHMCHFDETPEAEFDFTPTTCGGGTLDASASSDDVEIVKWEWDFCDDGTGDYDDASGESVLYSGDGTCNVGLRVTDNLGQTATIRHDVTVAGGPVVQVTTDADGCVEIGSTVEFSIVSLTYDTPIASYQWTFDDGLTGISDTSPTTSRTIPTNNGVTATLKVTDELGCIGVDHVSVCAKPPQEVPILTPAGVVALIGMLCIVGAGRILTKGRRS